MYAIGYQRIQFMRRALHLHVYSSQQSFSWVLNQLGESCVYCHPQTDHFIVWQLFSVARHMRCFKLGSKPSWLMSFRFFRYIYSYVHCWLFMRTILHWRTYSSWQSLTQVLNPLRGVHTHTRTHTHTGGLKNSDHMMSYLMLSVLQMKSRHYNTIGRSV